MPYAANAFSSSEWIIVVTHMYLLEFDVPSRQELSP